MFVNKPFTYLTCGYEDEDIGIFSRSENSVPLILIKAILIHKYQHGSTRVNANQHESTRINTSLTRINTSLIRVNTNQHEFKTS